MESEGILGDIDALIAREHELRSAASDGVGLTDEQRQEIAHIEVRLDQCWDLLRQRRARIDSGGDVSDAALRTEDVVEKYLD